VHPSGHVTVSNSCGHITYQQHEELSLLGASWCASWKRSRHAGPPTVDGYRVSAVCGCGAEFKRWVTLDDADEDLLKSALLAFEN